AFATAAARVANTSVRSAALGPRATYSRSADGAGTSPSVAVSGGTGRSVGRSGGIGVVGVVLGVSPPLVTDCGLSERVSPNAMRIPRASAAKAPPPMASHFVRGDTVTAVIRGNDFRLRAA